MKKRPLPPTSAQTIASTTPAASLAPKRSAHEGLYDPSRSIGYLLNRSATLIAARFSDELKSHDVNLQAWRVLTTLGHQGGQSLTDLANHTGAELSYLTRSVATVEARGLVKRLASPTDRRTVLLSLTPAGRQLVKRITPSAVQVEAASLIGVSKADLDATLRTLKAIYHNLVVDAEELPGINRKLTVARRVRKRALSENV